MAPVGGGSVNVLRTIGSHRARWPPTVRTTFPVFCRVSTREQDSDGLAALADDRQGPRALAKRKANPTQRRRPAVKPVTPNKPFAFTS